MLGVAFFMAKTEGGCIFKEQNFEGVAFLRSILAGVAFSLLKHTNYTKYRTKHLRKQIFSCIIKQEVKNMAFCYNKLWKLLIDKGMSKTDLRNMTGISQSTIAKMVNGENINTEVLERICHALNCDIEDIMEYRSESNEN